MLSHLRQAIRQFRLSPIFTVTAVLSVALGIAASSTIFALADALLLAPAVGVRDAGGVLDIGRSTTGRRESGRAQTPGGFDNMSHPAFLYLRDHTQTLSGMAAVHFGGSALSLTTGGTSERITGTIVSGNYFDVLGTQPALGRFFTADEDRMPGARPVVVLTHALWTTRFGARPDILGTDIRVNNRAFTVIGVAEPGFAGTTLVGTDLWIPTAMIAEAWGLANTQMLTDPAAVWHVAIGRPKPGVSRAQVQAELVTLMEAFKAQEPRANRSHSIAVIPLSRIPGPVRTPFLGFVAALFLLTTALLAIACSNVAGMLLVRASTRRREMATRLAIGASRGRLLAQLLTEIVVLFAVAAALALPLTMWLTRALMLSLPALPMPLNVELTVNARVMAFAFIAALLTAVVFGLAPARHALGADLAPMLHGANATADRSRLRLRHGLVVAQVALSLMLVGVSLLFVRTLGNAGRIAPGFRVADIDLASIDVALAGYRDQQAVSLLDRFHERLSSISGITHVAAAKMIPLQGSSMGLGSVHVEGRQQGPDGSDELAADWNAVTADYFATLDMRMAEGRPFSATDRDGAPMVAIVNETFARQAWPDRPAVGQRFIQRRRESDRTLEVVGVVADAKYRYISEEPHPHVFVPLAQQPMSDVTFFVRHEPGRRVSADVRQAIAQVEPAVPVLFVQPLEEAVAIGLLPQRLTAWIAGSVGGIGTLLAALGLYGLMAFLVAQRTREIAIRMALGASTRAATRLVLAQAARLTVIGVVIGLLLSAGAGTVLDSLLVGITPLDPVTTATTTLLIISVLGIACWIPARRAARTNPATALRAE